MEIEIEKNFFSSNDQTKGGKKETSDKNITKNGILGDPKKIKSSEDIKVTFLASIMNFMYGFRNAQRLSDIIDSALEKVEIYKKLCECKDPRALEKDFSNSIEDEKKEGYNFDKSRYWRIMTNEYKASEFKIVLWHMILIGILSITKSDLNFDFDIEKTNVDGHFRNLIYNYVASDKFKNKILSFLAVKAHPYPFFMLLYVFLLESLEIAAQDGNKPVFFKKICVCFLKIAFYKMERIASSKEQKDTDFLNNWRSLVYELKECFYCHKKHGWRTKSMAQYLYLTGELEDWWKCYKNELVGYFGSDVICFSQNQYALNFRYFLPYLNKIEPLSERYKKTKEFWKMFFSTEISGYKVLHFNNLNSSFMNVAAYLSVDQVESVWKDLVCSDLKEVIKPEQLLKKICDEHGYNCKNTQDELKRCMSEYVVANHNKQMAVDEKEVSSFFDELVVRFFEMKWENLSTDDKNFIEYVSKTIINNQDTQFKKSSGNLRNQNKINVINEKPDDKNDKNSEIATNNSIKTIVDNTNERSIFDKVNTNTSPNLSYKMPSLQQTNLQQK